MSGYAIAGVWLLLVALCVCTFAAASWLTRVRDDREEAGYARLRAAAPPWADDPTPIHDALAAERVIEAASEVYSAEWERQEGDA